MASSADISSSSPRLVHLVESKTKDADGTEKVTTEIDLSELTYMINQQAQEEEYAPYLPQEIITTAISKWHGVEFFGVSARQLWDLYLKTTEGKFYNTGVLKSCSFRCGIDLTHKIDGGHYRFILYLHYHHYSPSCESWSHVPFQLDLTAATQEWLISKLIKKSIVQLTAPLPLERLSCDNKAGLLNIGRLCLVNLSTAKKYLYYINQLDRRLDSESPTHAELTVVPKRPDHEATNFNATVLEVTNDLALISFYALTDESTFDPLTWTPVPNPTKKKASQIRRKMLRQLDETWEGIPFTTIAETDPNQKLPYLQPDFQKLLTAKYPELTLEQSTNRLFRRSREIFQQWSLAIHQITKKGLLPHNEAPWIRVKIPLKDGSKVELEVSAPFLSGRSRLKKIGDRDALPGPYIFFSPDESRKCPIICRYFEYTCLDDEIPHFLGKSHKQSFLDYCDLIKLDVASEMSTPEKPLLNKTVVRPSEWFNWTPLPSPDRNVITHWTYRLV